MMMGGVDNALNTTVSSSHWYDKDKKSKAAGEITWGQGVQRVVPDGCYFVVINNIEDYADTLMFLVSDSDIVAPQEYLAYGESTTPTIREELIPEKSQQIALPLNVYNDTYIIQGKRLDVYTKNHIDDANSVISGFGEVKENTKYRISDPSFYAASALVVGFYKDNDTWLTGALVSEASDKTFTTPSGCRYIRMSPKLAAYSGVMIKEAENYTPNYVPYPLTKPVETKFNGIWNSVGDSITAQRIWQKFVLYRTNLDWRNKGQGGQRIAGTDGFWKTAFDPISTYCLDGLDEENTELHPQLITLSGGVNDWGGSVTLGNGEAINEDANIFDNSVTKYDTTTVAGGLKQFIERTITKFPNTRLVICGLSFVAHPPTSGWSDGFTGGGEINRIGLKPQDYSNLIKDIAAIYNIPFVDVLGNCGWNLLNLRDYAPDDVHLNEKGGERIGSVISAKIKQLDL